MIRKWTDSFQQLSRAWLDLATAEVEALREDYSTGARHLGKAALIVCLTLFTIFWVLGVAVWLAIEVGGLWLPRWAAGLIVLGVLIVVTLVLAMMARAKLRQLEAPAATLRRHVDDHLGWWQQQISAPGSGRLAPPDADPAASQPGGAIPERASGPEEGS